MSVPNGWQNRLLDDVLLSSEYGSSQPATEHGTRPIVGMKNLQGGRVLLQDLSSVEDDENLDRLRLRAGDILLNRTNSPDLVGKVGVVRGETDAIFASYLVRLNANTQIIDPYYLNYWMNGAQAQQVIKRTATRGVSQANINPSTLKRQCHVLVPPLPEQRKIAELLRTWDDAIDRLTRSIKAQVERRGAVIAHLVFGGGAPQGTRWRKANSTWTIHKIGEIAEERTRRNTDLSADAVLSCSKHHGFLLSSAYFGRTVHSADLSNYKVVLRNEFGFPSNHVEEGSIGLQNVVEAGAVSPIYTVFGFDENRVDAKFAILVLKSKHYTEMFRASTSATVDRRGSLRWKQFSTLPFPVPPMTEQKRIADIAASMDDELNHTKALLSQMETQKRGLMQQLLTGKIRVNVGEGTK